MSSKGFTFNQPALPGLNSIDKMPFDDFFNMEETNNQLPSFPPKSIREIVRLVDANKSDEISILEWLDVIENKHQWQLLDKDEVNDACRAVWLAICTNFSLGDIAFFKVALALDNRETTLVSELIDSMEIVRHVPKLDQLNKDKIEWLVLVADKDYRSITQRCYSHNITPMGIIRKLRLPKANTYLKQVSDKLVKTVPPKLNARSEVWLEKCFNELVTTKEKELFCEAAIHHFSDYDYGLEIETLLEEHCLPMSENTYWYDITESSKKILRTKFEISSYYELKMISRKLTSDDGIKELEFEEHEARQIHSRTMFWSNYSSRFNRIRGLLPHKTYDYIQASGQHLSDQIESFNSNCEVYIFELEKIIVVEFLRGELSETRFFKNNEWNAKRLFESKDLSIDAIKEMSQLEVHDHVTSWQYFCEKLLRTKFKLLPNDKIPYFKGLPPTVNTYSSTVGLPIPEQSYLDERAEKLERWLEEFWQAEFKTTKYGDQSGLQQKSNVYLSKAHVAQQLGKADDHEFYIKKSANQGNPEAMNQLGLLLVKSSDLSLRRHGERWLRNAAKVGHVNAKEFVKKHRIQEVDLSPVNESKSLRSQADNGNFNAMCLYGLELLGSARQFDQETGVNYLRKAHELDESLTRSHLWKAYYLVKNSRDIKLTTSIFELLFSDKSGEELLEQGKQMMSGSHEEVRGGFNYLCISYSKGIRAAKTSLWDIVGNTKDKQIYEDVLRYLSSIGEVKATNELNTFLKNSKPVRSSAKATKKAETARKKAEKAAVKD